MIRRFLFKLIISVFANVIVFVSVIVIVVIKSIFMNASNNNLINKNKNAKYKNHQEEKEINN